MGLRHLGVWLLLVGLGLGVSVHSAAATLIEYPLGERNLQIHLSEGNLAPSLAEKVASLLNDWQAMLSPDEASVLPISVLPVSGNTALVNICAHWQKILGAYFSCQQQALLEPWQSALIGGELPDRTAQRQRARELASQELFGAENISPPTSLLDALLLENLAELLKQALPARTQVRLQLDAIQIAFQSSATENALTANRFVAPPWWEASTGLHLILAGGALVYKDLPGDDWRIGNRGFVPLVSPVDGWPLLYANRLLVVAADAVTAVSFAEAVATMPISEALAQINHHPDVEAVIMTATGKLFPSADWYSLVIPDPEHPPLWGQDWEFLIEYEIPVQSTAQYRRPYVALWITDEKQRPVRQLLVHGKNLRWLREIPLWWRRHGRQDETAIDGVSGATPQPGRHLLVWDGRDDHGRPVMQGRYLLHIEAAREHGERELLTLDFELSERDFLEKRQGKKELGWVKVSLNKTVD